jgi:hypothetical protein
MVDGGWWMIVMVVAMVGGCDGGRDGASIIQYEDFDTER